MLRKLWHSMFNNRQPSIAFIPSSEQLPGLWRINSNGRQQPNIESLTEADSTILMDLCDQYWNSFFNDFSGIRSSEIHRRALDLLAERGAAAIDWACNRLHHPGYDAREDAAYLLGELAGKNQLGGQQPRVIAGLAELATRPWKEDTKEIQANTVAVHALDKIGGSACIAVMKKILTSSKWDQDDLQWDAVEVLSRHTGKNFMEEDDPVAEAKAWIASG